MIEVVVTTRAIRRATAKLQSNSHHQQPFLSLNQQCQSTEGKEKKWWQLTKYYVRILCANNKRITWGVIKDLLTKIRWITQRRLRTTAGEVTRDPNIRMTHDQIIIIIKISDKSRIRRYKQTKLQIPHRHAAHSAGWTWFGNWSPRFRHLLKHGWCDVCETLQQCCLYKEQENAS